LTNSVPSAHSRWADLRGSQTPRIESVPTYTTTAGPEAVELAHMARMMPDAWQRRVLDGALGQDAQNNWTAPEVGLVVGRQNGKGGIIEVTTLNGLYLRNFKMVYTAHLMATSRKIRERIQWLIESVPDFDSQVKQIRTANEEQSITLKPLPTLISGSDTRFVRSASDPARIDFVARTGAAARGWAGYDVIFFDEAFALSVEMVGAMMPIMFARPNWQIWYVSMAGMANSSALRQVRIRGINGDPELAYYEWSVDEAYHDAPEYVRNMPVAWAQSNPALGDRITIKTIQRALRSMDPGEFGREVLCAWDDPGGMAVINLSQWMMLVDLASQISGGMVFALDVAEGMTSGAIGVAGYRPDRIPHVEITSKDGVLDHRMGVEWMVPRAKELNDKWHPGIPWMVDTSGPAGALVPDLEAAGIEVTSITGNSLAAACGGLLKAVQAPLRDGLRHLGQEVMTAAILAARKRNVGDGGWAFGRLASAADITPLTTLTLALHGLMVYGSADYDILESVR
jgi:hypothetical protein